MKMLMAEYPTFTGAITAEEFESQYQTFDGTAAQPLPAHTLVAPYCKCAFPSPLLFRQFLFSYSM